MTKNVSEFYLQDGGKNQLAQIWNKITSLTPYVLTTPPHLKYVATLHCNLLLMACFGDINVSRGSVATYARCGGTFNIQLTANLPRNLPVVF